MASVPTFPGFDALMALSRREGVDIRPTLLRVLTDLYVQTPNHTEDEERHFVTLASRLIDEVDDATRAMVRGRLSVYPHTPAALTRQLALQSAPPSAPFDFAADAVDGAAATPEAECAGHPSPMQSAHASQISEMFFAADGSKRRSILHSLRAAPAQRSARIATSRLDRACENLEQAAFVGDAKIFAVELGNVLMLPSRLAEQIVSDPGGEPLACAARALDLPQATFERILLFLDPARGASVPYVYRLARLYSTLDRHVALVMLAAFRGASLAATRAKYTPVLHQDERQRARATEPTARPAPRAAAPHRIAGTN